MATEILTGWQVLIVDDNPDTIDLVHMLLTHYGAEVHAAENGAQGLALARSLHPDFIISDLAMPVMDGWKLIAKLKEDRATMDIPVIALTANEAVTERERAMAAGFHNFLEKPLTATTFVHDLLSLLVDVPALDIEWTVNH